MLSFKRIMVFLAVCGFATGIGATPRDALLLIQGECFGCHNPEKKKGDVVLTARESLLRNGEKLLAAIEPGSDPHMPPKKQLSTNQMALLRDWLGKGAEWRELEVPAVKLGALHRIISRLLVWR